MGSFIAPYKRVKMRWVSGFNQTAVVAGVPTALFFASNDIVDVAGAGIGGRNPMGFDQIAAFYRRWMVVSSKIRCLITPLNTTSSPGLPLIFGVSAEPVARSVATLQYPTLTGPRSYVESGMADWTVINPGAALTARAFELSARYSATKVFGQADAGDDALWGTTTGSPVELNSFAVWWAPANSSAVGVAADYYNIFVVIDFYVLWADPIAIPAS